MIKSYKKSQIASWRFDDMIEMLLWNGKFIAKGWIGDKRAWYLETRDRSGNLIESITFFNLTKLKAAL